MEGVHVGVAGWSYPDWRGVFYPRSGRGGELQRVARLFDCVEINVSFYRIPQRSMSEKWLKDVEGCPEFLFTTKVPKELTHERTVDPRSLRQGAELLRDALAPLIEAGRLGAVLLQFPWYFRDSPESRERIRLLVEAFHPVPAAVELRHRSFFFTGPVLNTEKGSALRFLEELGAGLVNIDVPHSPGTVPPTSINTSSLGYVRLHGRNAKSWFNPKAGRDEKYDYLYSLEELKQWADRIQLLSARTQHTFVIANNHYRAQAPANALELLCLLGRQPQEAPQELLDAYPRLAQELSAGGRS